VADGSCRAATELNTPSACGSPATWSPAPSETGWPEPNGITEMGLLDEAAGSPKSASITSARSLSAKGSGHAV